MFISKRYFHLLNTPEAYKWRLNRLHIENAICFRENILENESWKSVFIELHKLRDLWQQNQQQEQPDGENFFINVGLRFIPKKENMHSNHSTTNRKVTLPLHQRLALIKLGNNIQTNKEAITILKNNGEWFKDHWNQVEKKRPREINNEKKCDKDDNPSIPCGLHDIDTRGNRVTIVDATKGLREFQFDRIIEESTNQETVYESFVKKIVFDFINGFNASCLVYGQTGSGKTYTMFGPDGDQHHVHSNLKIKNDHGIVPRVCNDLFSALNHREHNLNLRMVSSVFVSYVQIYGNEISDLLKNGISCGQSKVSSQRFVLSGASEIKVTSTSDILALLKQGDSWKRKAQTAMNARSSRAHTIFILNLNQQCLDTGVSAKSKLFLVDLGGSEQTKKSKIEAGKSKHYEILKTKTMGGTLDFTNSNEKIGYSDQNEDEKEYSTGFKQSERMREAVYINLGLLALKQCVEALKTKNSYVPYSTSKLTMMLSTGLGGNSKTSVIVCANQSTDHHLETISAMKFGEDCRKISKTVKTASSMICDILAQLDNDIKSCEENIKKKEKWEMREIKRIDSLGENQNCNIEVHKTAVLVGAEEDRHRLNELLQRRALLTGTSITSSFNGMKFGGNLGFGNANRYGFGSKFEACDDKENYRFKQSVENAHVPHAVKTSWKTGEELAEDLDKLSGRAKTSKRNKLAYSGISS